MLEKIRIIFSIPELRKKILLTLLLLLVFRVGSLIHLPVIDQSRMTAYAENMKKGDLGALLNTVAIFSASDISQATIFGLGIMPYISASIIFQLLGSVYEPLKKLQKEGETGRKKINEWTRYATVVICLFQSAAYLGYLVKSNLMNDAFLTSNGHLMMRWWFMSIFTMTCGTAFLMWLGEQIDEYGIGNGISLLIMAGIVARMPRAAQDLFGPIFTNGLQIGSEGGAIGVEKLLVLGFMFVAVVAGVVFVTLGQRRIPTQTAKHVRGRRQFGGNRQYLPLRVNQAGVMPIIFASSLLMFPQLLFRWLQSYHWDGFWGWFANIGAECFNRGSSLTYNLMYIVLIYFFCYFWTAITFNPQDMAENLKNYGTFIPGHRPGKRTAHYLEKVMVRITYVGAAFLAVVAILPTIISTEMGVGYDVSSFFGGTGLLIAVSVAFDLVQKIDSHLVMRNYTGLLQK